MPYQRRAKSRERNHVQLLTQQPETQDLSQRSIIYKEHPLVHLDKQTLPPEIQIQQVTSRSIYQPI